MTTLVLGMDMAYYAKMSSLYSVGYSLSLFAALAVLLTGILFYKDMVKNKIYMKLLMGVSASDALVSVFGLFGFGTGTSAFICEAQGITWYLGNRASWMFTVGITVTLFTQVTYDRIFVQFNAIFIIIIIISVILILLPLVVTEEMIYGGADNCAFNLGALRSVHETTDITLKEAFEYDRWYTLMFFTPFVCCAGLTLSLVIYMHYSIYHRTLDPYDPGAKIMMRTILSILYYPLIMVIFWFPVFLTKITRGNLAASTQEQQATNIQALLGTGVWSSLYPLGVSAYYFYKSDEARMRWKKLLNLSVHDTLIDMPVDKDKLTGSCNDGKGILSRAGGYDETIATTVYSPTNKSGLSTGLYTNEYM